MRNFFQNSCAPLDATLWTDVVDEETCWEILEEAEDFEPSAILVDHRDEALALHLRTSTQTDWHDPGLATLLLPLAHTLAPDARHVCPDFRLLRYTCGQHFVLHTDAVRHAPGGLTSHHSLLLYLNDDFDGGQTRLVLPDQDLVVPPRTGSVLMFRHELPHEGLPVLAGTKYVLRSEVYSHDPA